MVQNGGSIPPVSVAQQKGTHRFFTYFLTI
nr:MAG TPA: hypothetical protein [Caudoviricetes sp.]DAW86715.1 MAG TPA: hypothetical protein [Bacteriophage sp.]